MSFITTGFKNLGHYFAVGAKYIAIGIADIVKVANAAQPLAPEVDALVGVFAGPAGAQISDLAFHALGSVAAALEPIGVDAAAQIPAQGLNITLDAQTVADIKAAAKQIQSVLSAVGAQKPKA